MPPLSPQGETRRFIPVSCGIEVGPGGQSLSLSLVRRKTSHLLLLAAAPSASAAERYRDEKAHSEAPQATYIQTTMTTNAKISDAVWDEDRRSLTAETAASNMISFNKDDELFEATREALPWQDPDEDGHGGDPGRMIIASVWIENLFREANCPRPQDFKSIRQGPFKFLTRCLHLNNYVNKALALLIHNGLLRCSDDPDEIHIFRDKTELYSKADKLVKELQDEEALIVTDKAWDWTRDFVSATARTLAQHTA